MKLFNSSSSVIRLLFTGSPFAVVRRIVTVVIDALDGKPFRARPHVGVEIFKRLVPSVAYNYAAATIARVRLSFAVIAPFMHSAPDVMFRRMRHAVFERSIPGSPLSKTPAGFGQSPFNAFYNQICYISAFTLKICKQAISWFGFTYLSYYRFANHFHNVQCTYTIYGVK